MSVFVTYLEFVSPLTVKYSTAPLGFEGAVQSGVPTLFTPMFNTYFWIYV